MILFIKLNKKYYSFLYKYVILFNFYEIYGNYILDCYFENY